MTKSKTKKIVNRPVATTSAVTTTTKFVWSKMSDSCKNTSRFESASENRNNVTNNPSSAQDSVKLTAPDTNFANDSLPAAT